MTFIPSKKRRRRHGGYKDFLTSKKEDGKRQQMSTYKSYLTASDEQVPKSTKKRWNTALGEHLQDVAGPADPSHHGQQDVAEPGPSHHAQQDFLPLPAVDDDDESSSMDVSDHDSDKASEKLHSSDLTSEDEGPTVSSDEYESDYFDSCDNFDDDESSHRSESPTDTDNPQYQSLPLYEGSTIELSTAISSILDFYISNDLSKVGLAELLKLIDSMLPSPNQLPKTKYQLDQFILKNSPSTNYTKHYYCCMCYQYIGSNVDETVTRCPICESEGEKKFFLTYDFKSLLKNFLENGSAYKYLFQTSNAPTDSVSDVTNGLCYRELKQKHKSGPRDLTLIWNTDGVPVFKSSKSQLWPLQFTLAEIPPHARNRFVLVCGIWYGTEKPDMNLFLKPFAEDLKELYKSGFEWCHPETKELIKSKVFAPVSCLDAVARASVMNIHQFNGEFGCNICEDEGDVIPCGKGNSRIYRLQGESVLRTKESFIQSAEKAVEIGKPRKGVKGPSVLSTVFYFNLAYAFVPDYMHSVLLGVVRQFLFLWMNPSYRFEPWSLSSKKAEMNKKIEDIRPPNEINRMPRSLDLIKYWKASELRSWLLFYSVPTLSKTLPQKYFEHWLMLVFSIFTLLQDKVSTLEINLCSVSIRMFCERVEDLYGQEQLTFNLHQLTHLPLSVERWGPLWATSAFIFENNNGLILKLIHGTQQVTMQLANTFKYINSLCVLKSRIERLHLEAPRSAENCSVGKPLKSKPQLLFNEKNMITNYFSCSLEDIKFFSKCSFDKFFLTSLSYQKSTKRNNFTVMYRPDASSLPTNLFIGFIKFFVKKNNQPEVCCIVERHNKKMEFFYNKESNITIRHIIPINVDPSGIDIVPLSCMTKKLVFLNKELVACQPNVYEVNL